jgi:hypothetical protein
MGEQRGRPKIYNTDEEKRIAVNRAKNKHGKLMYTCEVCKCEITKGNKWKHGQTKRHNSLLSEENNSAFKNNI